MRDHRHQHFAAFVVTPALDQALDRNFRIAHRRGNLGQHAGPVGDGKADIVAPDAIARIGGRECLQLLHRNGKRRAQISPRNVDQIGDDRAGGRPGPGTGALKQQAAREITFRHHRIGRARHGGKRMAAGHQARANPLQQSRRAVAFVDGSDADQPDDIAQRPGLRDVRRAHFADTGRIDIGEIDPRAKADGRQDGQLVRGIDTFDVKCGVGLGKTLRLGFRQHGVEVGARPLHFRQDVITGAVENTVDPLDTVGRRSFAQALHHRYAARNRGLEFQRHAAQGGLFRQRQAVMRDHRLVRRHESLALVQRRPRQRQRWSVRATDQFEHDIHIRPGGHRLHVVDPGERRQVHAAVARAVAGVDRNDLKRTPRAAFDRRTIGFEQLDHAGADSAEPGEGYA